MGSTLNRDKINVLDKLQEVAGKAKSIISGKTKRESQEVLGISRPNFIVNGDHQVNQRGLLPVTGVTNNTYEATDRWKTLALVVTGDGSLTGDLLKATATSTGTGYLGYYQPIEDYASLHEKTVAVSASVKSNNANARLLFYDGSAYVGSSSPHSGGGNTETLTSTFTVSGSATALQCYVAFISNTGGTVSITSGDYIGFTGVSLEIGDTATPFEKEPYAEVLRKCQRYYWKLDNTNTYEPICTSFARTATNAVGIITFPVVMRTAPTFNSFSNAGDFEVKYGNTAAATTSISLSGSADSPTRGEIDAGLGSAVLTVGEACSIRFDATATAYISFEAEL